MEVSKKRTNLVNWVEAGRGPDDGARYHSRCSRPDWPYAKPPFWNWRKLRHHHYRYSRLGEHRKARCRSPRWCRLQRRRLIEDPEVLRRLSVWWFSHHPRRDHWVVVVWFYAESKAPIHCAPLRGWMIPGTLPLGLPKHSKNASYLMAHQTPFLLPFFMALSWQTIRQVEISTKVIKVLPTNCS